MSTEFLMALVEAFKTILLRAAGSKRLMSFLCWLIYLGLVRPDYDMALLTFWALAILWGLFQLDAGDDSEPAPKKEGN